MSFWKSIATNVKGVSLASSGDHASEFSGFIDTGCLPLNALLSGTIYGGMPNNKIVALGGDPATGKTFFALSIIQNFLNSNPEAGVVYYDTEASVTIEMMESRGIDINRVLISEPSTIQEFRTHVVNILDEYEKTKDRPPMMIVLDSLGMLSSQKEMEDIASGKESRDMTKAQLIRGTFRVLTLKLARLKVPLLMTSHVYEVVGAYIPTKAMSGGGGLQYAASIICMLSKKVDRDSDKDVIGSIIKITLAKSRLTKEKSTVSVKLSHSTGLDKYFGLLELAEEQGIVKKSGNKWEFPDGTKAFENAIAKTPEKFYTPEVLKLIDEAAGKEFLYGSGKLNEEVESD